ncbi:MAG: 23S rRNA (pseudouridine(1915)-N(3))-methyltransferase RlmH, partial [Gallionella sp.]
MRLLIVTVGHKMPDWITKGYNEYAKRMPREVKLELVEVKPESRTTGKTTEQIMQAEAQRILHVLPANCLRIAMDERGA